MPTEGQLEALRWIKQQVESTPRITVTEVTDSVFEIPAVLTQALTKTTAVDAVKLLAPTTEAAKAGELNAKSPYKLKFVDASLSVEQWASGRGAPLSPFKDDGMSKFFENIFNLAAAQVLSITGACSSLGRRDLFHCHLVFARDARASDILLLFHAREYPDIYEADKVRKATALEPTASTFRVDHAAYKRRNSLFSVTTKRLYNLNFETPLGHPATPLLASLVEGFDDSLRDDILAEYNDDEYLMLRLDQDNLGTCLTDINYFPTEGVAPFAAKWLAVD